MGVPDLLTAFLSLKQTERSLYMITNCSILRIASLTTGEYPSIHRISGLIQTLTVFFSLQIAGSMTLYHENRTVE